MVETGGSWVVGDTGTRRRAQWKTTFNGSGSEIDALDLAYKTTASSYYAFTSSNANDSVGSNNLTENGTPTYSSAGGVDGNYIIFNGSSQYLTASANTVFDITTQDFSFCGYIYRTSDSGSDEYVLRKRGASGGYYLRIGSTDKLEANIHDGTNGATASSSSSISTNTWYFWAASFARAGNCTLHLFNVSTGAYESSTASITAVGSATNSDTFTVARNSNGASGYFPGRMDSIRYYPYALSTLQVQALFSTYGRYAFNGGVTDSSGNGYDLTANGTPTYGIDGGIYGQYIILNGSSQYLTASANTVFDVTTGDFSLWGYLYRSSDSGGFETVVAKHTGTVGYIVDITSSDKLRFLVGDGSDSVFPSSTSSISTGVWYFWAATADRDGSATLHLYNLSTGAYESATSSMTAVDSITNSNTFTVGRASSGASAYFPGRQDHLNVLLGTALTTQNVKDLISTLHGGQIAECHGTGSGFTTGITYRRNMENTAWEQLVDATSTQTLTNKTLTSPTVTAGTYTNIAYRLGGDELAASASSISLTGLTAKKKLRITAFVIGKTSASQIQVRFNNDSGNNYAYRHSSNLGAYTTATSAAQILLEPVVANSADTRVYVIEVDNLTAQEKMLSWHGGQQQSTGAGTNGNHIVGSAKWANTSAQITRVDIIASAGEFDTGSYLIVEGMDAE